MKPDPQEAMEWYEKAAALGNGDAMAELSTRRESECRRT